MTGTGHTPLGRRKPCPGFGANKAAAAPGPFAPRVRFRGRAVIVVNQLNFEEMVVEELEQVGPWALMSVFEEGGRMLAVFEDFEAPDGRIVFVSEEGTRLELGKSLEPTEAGGATWYRGHDKEDVLPGQRDILRYELLRGRADPGPDDVRACFPPVRRSFWQGLERPHTFIGTPGSADVIPCYYVDLPMVSRVPIEVAAPGTLRASRAEILWEGLVGSWLPVVRTVYPLTDDECWEVVSFAKHEGASTFLQPTWYRFVKLKAGRVETVKYVDSYIPYPEQAFRSADFYRSLLSAHTYWQEALRGSMRLRAPEDWVEPFCRHAIALEMITRIGDHPKYGVVERAYAGSEHDGFQDELTSTVTCALEWGLFSRARGYLDYYFKHFVRQDGTLKYRGPEIGKYGVMLSCMAQYYEYTEDGSLLGEHDQKLRAIVVLLVGRWEEARRLGPANPAYGMLKGYHEADITFLRAWESEVRNVSENPYQLTGGPGEPLPDVAQGAPGATDYEQPYLSNSAEAWRGLRDIARAWQRAGSKLDDAEMAERGETLAQSADLLFADAQRGIERSWIDKDGVLGLPIIAGSSTFYWEEPYRLSPASFDENRVWSELLHSGVAPKETVTRIMEIAAERGGTTLGIFNNRQNVVAFLVAEAVSGLLQHDLVPEALLVFYAHAFHAHTRGTWTALECVDMDRDRAAHSAYCAPAQVTIPTIAKWLLVFEEPLDGTVVLAKGTPRAWLADGKGFGVEGCPTRWGPVTYSVSSHLSEGWVEAEISMPPRPGAIVQLRLRLPSGYSAGTVEVLGSPDVTVTLAGEYLNFPRECQGRVTLRIGCTARLT